MATKKTEEEPIPAHFTRPALSALVDVLNAANLVRDDHHLSFEVTMSEDAATVGVHYGDIPDKGE